MSWPKGKSRKNYVKGSKRFVDMAVEMPRATVGTDTESPVSEEKQGEIHLPSLPLSREERLERHWGHEGTKAVTEVCPNCYYVYADGGWCEKCGWAAPILLDEWDTNRGRKYR